MPDSARLMAAPVNRIPVRPARGSRSILGVDIDKIQEGELVYARDEDSLYIKDDGQLVSVGQGVGIVDQILSAKITFDVKLSGNGLYTFDGPGMDNTLELPTIYLMRGQQYKFVHDLESDAFLIATTNGTPYNVGVVGNPADESSVEWTVSMQAPQNLRYISGSNPANTGKFIVLSDTFSLALNELDDVDASDPNDGDSLMWSESQQEWKPAPLTTGGVTSLNGLTDVDTSNVIQDDVLKYNGQFWVAAPEATDPGTAGRKSTLAVDDTRSGQMVGTEFILLSDDDWDSLGFDRIPAATNNGADEWEQSQRITWLDTWSPLGRSDSASYGDYLQFDGSGRIISWTNFPNNHVPVSSTKKLSVPQNNALCLIGFLAASQVTVYRAGDKFHTYKGRQWYVLRVEYQSSGGKLAMEYWLNAEGHIKILYGRPEGTFTFQAGPNKNGLVFAARSDDATLGNANIELPGLDGTKGDYSAEFWYNGSGYNLDDLANVADGNVEPPRQDFPLVWNDGAWKPGSIVRDGSQASTSGGNLGLFAVDSTYLYVCVGENQWKRVTLESFS